MRTLVPKSLWSCLSNPIPGSTRAKHRAMLGLALEERIKHLDKAVHQAHDWLCSNPLPWDPILWAHPHDPLNPFSVTHGAFSTSVHMPPWTRPIYQHPPPLPKHALKKPSKPASAKAQPTARRAPKNSKRPSSRASAPRPPPPLGHPPPSSALTPTATTKTPSITTNPPGHNRLGAPKARQDRSPPPTPKLQGTLPSNTPTSPLKARPYWVPRPVCSCPPPLQRLPGHPEFFPPIQRFSVSSSRPLQPSAPSGTPPLPHRVNQRSSNPTIRAAVYISLYVDVNTFFGGHQPQNKLMRLRTFKKLVVLKNMFKPWGGQEKHPFSFKMRQWGPSQHNGG